jgi:hypothetical protein
MFGNSKEIRYYNPKKNIPLNHKLNMLGLNAPFKNFSPVSLAQLVGQFHIICRGPGFEPQSSHLSTLRLEFQATRVLDKKKKEL